MHYLLELKTIESISVCMCIKYSVINEYLYFSLSNFQEDPYRAAMQDDRVSTVVGLSSSGEMKALNMVDLTCCNDLDIMQ